MPTPSGMPATGARRVRIAFVVERGLLDAAVLGLERNARAVAGAFDAALRLAWDDRRQWREAGRSALRDADREALGRALDGDADLAAGLAAAPSIVRAAALADLEAEARLWEALRRQGAPRPVVLYRRARIAEALASLDPAATPIDEPLPAVAIVQDVRGRVLANVHDFLDRWLRLACRPDHACCVAEDASPDQAQAAGSRPTGRTGMAPADAWPGLQHTLFGTTPDDPSWCPPGFALPRRLDGGRLAVAGLCGGPVTFALAGDAGSPRLDTRLAAPLARLTATEAMVAFVAEPNDIDWPWAHVLAERPSATE